MRSQNKTATQRVASRYMEARLFGLLSNHIGWQDLSRFEKQLQWMFKKGQHKVTSVLDRKGEKVIKIESQRSTGEISGFKESGSGYDYKKITVKIDGRVVKKTESLDEVRHILADHFQSLGLR